MGAVTALRHLQLSAAATRRTGFVLSSSPSALCLILSRAHTSIDVKRRRTTPQSSRQTLAVGPALATRRLAAIAKRGARSHLAGREHGRSIFSSGLLATAASNGLRRSVVASAWSSLHFPIARSPSAHPSATRRACELESSSSTLVADGILLCRRVRDRRRAGAMILSRRARLRGDSPPFLSSTACGVARAGGASADVPSAKSAPARLGFVLQVRPW